MIIEYIKMKRNVFVFDSKYGYRFNKLGFRIFFLWRRSSKRFEFGGNYWFSMLLMV